MYWPYWAAMGTYRDQGPHKVVKDLPKELPIIRAHTHCPTPDFAQKIFEDIACTLLSAGNGNEIKVIFLADVRGIHAKARWKVGRSRDLGTARGIPVLVLKPFHSHLGLFLLLPWVPWQFVRLSFHEACM